MRALRTAYDVLRKMQAKKLQPPDEVHSQMFYIFYMIVVSLSKRSNMYICVGLLPGADAAVWTVWPACLGSQGPL